MIKTELQDDRPNTEESSFSLGSTIKTEEFQTCKSHLSFV